MNFESVSNEIGWRRWYNGLKGSFHKCCKITSLSSQHEQRRNALLGENYQATWIQRRVDGFSRYREGGRLQGFAVLVFGNQRLIFDNSNKFYVLDTLEKQAVSRRLPWYFVNKKGALVAQF
jgi:hypothetical protein